MLSAAVIGLGWWGRQIVSCLEGSDRIAVVKGVDIAPEAVAGFAAERGLAVVARYEDVLDDAAIDAVILATPHGLHERQVLAAAAAGKQIFCEKPLALDAAAAERMLAACDARGIVLGIGHERRFEAALERIAQIVGDGTLGTLLHIDINWSHNLFAGQPATGWRQDASQAPAGTLTALGVHMTDYMQSVAGNVAEVHARTSHRSADFPGDDIITIQLVFASGVTGVLSNIATTPFYQRITMFGDRGWVEARETTNVDDPAPATLTWRGMDEEIHSRSFRHSDTVRANLHAWADAVAGVGEYRFSRAEKLHNVQILEAIVASAASRQPQRIG